MENDLVLFKKIILPVFNAVQKAFGNFQTSVEGISERLYYPHSPYYTSKKTAFSYLKTVKGGYGEYLLCHRLRFFKGKWLFNLYIPSGDEKTEIDALFLCDRGIFLFESKNFSGRIYGKKGQVEWFQTIMTEKGLRKSRFFNPMMQNNAHKNALLKLIGEDAPIFPVVVFGKNAQLYTPVAAERPEELISLSKLSGTIRKKKRHCLSKGQIEQYYTTLSRYRVASSFQKQTHIQTIRTKH